MSQRLPILIFLTAFLCQCGGDKPSASKTGKPVVSAESEMIPLGLTDAGLHASPYSTGYASAPTEIARSPEAVASNGETEKLSKHTTEALKAILASPETAPPIQVTPLLPEALQTTFEDQSVQVLRWKPIARVGKGVLLTNAFASLLERFSKAPRIHLKPIGIQTSPSLQTQVLVELSGATANGHRREIHTTWTCEWENPSTLSNISLEAFEETSSNATPWLVDITVNTVLAEGTSVPPALIDGSIEYWTQHITRYGDLFQTGHHGLALGDVNGDGLDDVYVCDGGSLPNQLYIQQADGSIVQSGLGLLEDSRGALLIDLDNDGDQDLVVCTVAMIAFAENDGTGSFTLRGGHPGIRYGGSLSAADPDLDGDLDLYVCVYEGEDGPQGRSARGFQNRSPYPFHDATNGGRNVLLENLGNFEFIDSTERFGLEMNNTRWSFAAAWEDVDRDGDPDLYVANDFGRNHFYRNDAGKFTDIADSMRVEDMAAGMSVAWGDYNRDGAADLYVGNMFSSAGRRISYQEDFIQGRDPAALLGTQRMARGNSLFKAGPSAFDDVSETAGVTMGRWAWSSAFADLNNDGWEDLLVANGYLTNRRDDDL